MIFCYLILNNINQNDYLEKFIPHRWIKAPTQIKLFKDKSKK